MIATDSFMYLSEDVFAFFKGNIFHEDARGRALSLATPNNAGSFNALGINMRWKFELLDEVDKLNPPIFFNHQYFSYCGRGLWVSGLLSLYLD